MGWALNRMLCERVEEGAGLTVWSQIAWSQVLTIPSTDCVTLGKLFNVSVLCFPPTYKMKIKVLLSLKNVVVR